MSQRVETEGNSPFDTVKLLLAVAVLVGAVAAYYLFPEQSTLVRALGLVGAVVVAILIGLQTQTGRDFAAFLSGSRLEVRKMHWPSRQETVQTTLAVLAMVLVMGVMLWLLDMLLLWGSSFVVARGG